MIRIVGVAPINCIDVANLSTAVVTAVVVSSQLQVIGRGVVQSGSPPGVRPSSRAGCLVNGLRAVTQLYSLAQVIHQAGMTSYISAVSALLFLNTPVPFPAMIFISFSRRSMDRESRCTWLSYSCRQCFNRLMHVHCLASYSLQHAEQQLLYMHNSYYDDSLI